MLCFVLACAFAVAVACEVKRKERETGRKKDRHVQKRKKVEGERERTIGKLKKRREQCDQMREIFLKFFETNFLSK